MGFWRLGVSSHQFDVAERFSTRFDAELDMLSQKMTSMLIRSLMNMTRQKLKAVFLDYGVEKCSCFGRPL
jgi:16S rRNA C1402 N4-methylase RsmH